MTKKKVKLDQFYTQPDIAQMCLTHLFTVLADMGITADNEELLFVEPSAGTGSFFDLLPINNRLGLDIDPQHKEVEKKDFFSVVPMRDDTDGIVIIGNPPFGKRASLAVSFFNHSAYIASTVAFIVPIVFQKYSIHKRLDPSMKLVSVLELPREAFQLKSKKPYSVNTEFQIWTRLPTEFNDLRHYEPMPIEHKDFQMWQYNNTESALKVFDNEFDFAVPCQGWQDYTRRETDADACEKQKQWILLHTKDPITLHRLKTLDYTKLAEKCGTSVPGFRKCDLIKEFCDNYEKRN